MTKNYLLLFVRNLFKDKYFSFLNISGLVLGFTCFSIITLFAEFEFSYDSFHHESKNIYRVVKDFVTADGMHIPDATTPGALTPAVRTVIPEATAVTRISANGGRRNLFQYNDKSFYEQELLRIDSSFFKVFDFEFVQGSSARPFNGLHSLLLSETAARKYFGNENPIGKIIKTNINNSTDFEVTGVLKDVPANSHFTFQALIPFESRRNPDTDWNRSTFYTYVRLLPGTEPLDFEKKVQSLITANVPESLDEYHVQQLEAIHLRSRLKSELGNNGDIQYVIVLLTIGIFALIIAGINYVNLVTAQALKRAKEIGVRKVTGASRRSLMFQILLESTSITLVSALIAFALVIALLPALTPVIGIDLSSIVYSSNTLRLMLPVSVIAIGILAGAYPAFYLSSFLPLRVLRGRLYSTAHGIRLRQALVVFQFVISGVLIIGLLVVRDQLEFIRNKNLGFDYNAVVTVANVVGIASPEAIADDIKKLAGVKNVARASGGIFGVGNAINGVADKTGSNHMALNFIRADYDFIPTLGIEVLEGRNFSLDFPTDSMGIIINEAAASQLGLTAPFVGQTLKWDDASDSTHEVHIVGVVKDFHFTSFHESIKPFGFIPELNNGSTFFIKIGSNISGTLTEIEKVWKKHSPGKPFEYVFQDEYTGRLHASEQRFETLFSWFTVISMVIACLGLLGLVTAVSENKTKEIGIRKVLGSSVAGIVGLLSKELVALVIGAFVIAAPVSYIIMRKWLEEFAYRTPLHWEVFAIAAIAIVVIAMGTVCIQSIKAAVANPVDSLRVE